MYFLHLALELFCKNLSISSQPEGGELPTSGEKDSRPGEDFSFFQGKRIYRQCEEFLLISKWGFFVDIKVRIFSFFQGIRIYRDQNPRFIASKITLHSPSSSGFQQFLKNGKYHKSPNLQSLPELLETAAFFNLSFFFGEQCF